MAAPESLPAVVRAFFDALQSRFGSRLADVRLFGSYARGDATEDSDVDVCVLIEDLTHREKVEAVELAAMVALPTGLTLSALVMSPPELQRLRDIEARLALDIDREGLSV